jgi:hypothetical protein
MKKIFFAIILLSISGSVYSQYLVKNDVNIFINHYDALNDMINWHQLGKDEGRWKEYQLAIDTLYETINFENLLKGDVLYKNYERKFLELLNCEVPKELDDFFRNIGWRTNGNQKFWTIHYGVSLLYIQWELDEIFRMLEELIVEEYFDEDEIEEAENAIREIRNEIDPLDKNITKLLEMINIKDREIIKANLKELMEVMDL